MNHEDAAAGEVHRNERVSDARAYAEAFSVSIRELVLVIVAAVAVTVAILSFTSHHSPTRAAYAPSSVKVAAHKGSAVKCSYDGNYSNDAPGCK